MPDGAVRDGKKWLTSPMDIAREIHQGLANSALIAEVRSSFVLNHYRFLRTLARILDLGLRTWMHRYGLRQQESLIFFRAKNRLFIFPSHVSLRGRAQVDGVLWDMTRPLEGDCKLQIHKFDSDKGRDTFWHSSAHILGQSIEMTYGCKLCIGPCTTRGEVISFFVSKFSSVSSLLYVLLPLSSVSFFSRIVCERSFCIMNQPLILLYNLQSS